MPITFKVEEVGVLTMAQIIEIKIFIEERCKSVVTTLVDLTPQEPIETMVMHPSVNVEIPKPKKRRR
jgi:hypothetical protein